ncbi:aldo/keto reductase [Leptobacterium flavescens]|uniref:Aldo/keto reductase n=1 Tax=Leptobacterium flavescens TaxID=472055 RepID=A0A6P0URQ9_9FLAO|nr:aldo/keto reductase [Leptobacterium flavescens]NER15200.1 aldo/keto reductase [Leptobacterium flavescens]
MKKYSRREAAKAVFYASAAGILLPSLLSFKTMSMQHRKIPSSGELLPLVGLGTWQTFDVGTNRAEREQLTDVLRKMKEHGGKLIDSSPMYGSSEAVVGDLTSGAGIAQDFFYATKVWTNGRQAGIDQMKNSMKKMKRSTMDLMQIHNLVDWKTHSKTLRDWKQKGLIRYWGITHYTDSSHESLARIIRSEKPDFVQFNYSINSRHAEKNLLETARKNGTAVIINRPYSGGSLFRKVKGKSLPEWCKEYDINSWGQFFLKYLISHEAVNCVIPGTSKPHHLVDNMMAGHGKLPDENTRRKMVDFFEKV